MNTSYSRGKHTKVVAEQGNIALKAGFFNTSFSGPIDHTLLIPSV